MAFMLMLHLMESVDNGVISRDGGTSQMIDVATTTKCGAGND